LGTGLGVTGAGSSGSGVVTTGGCAVGPKVVQALSAVRPSAPAALSQRRRETIAGSACVVLIRSRSS